MKKTTKKPVRKTAKKLTAKQRYEKAKKIMERAQNKMIARKKLTPLEKKLQELNFQYSRHDAAKIAVKRKLI